MILLLGASGYIGSAFAKELDARGIEWRAIKHQLAIPSVDITADWHPVELVINCAAFIPPESVSLCDKNQDETIKGNVMLPARLAATGIPLAHISTGCLWSDGLEHSEDDPPQRAFTGHCGFYIGTKVMAEEEVRANPEHYIWRVRLPFDEFDSPRNYLSKLSKFTEVWDHDNTICHRGDFAKACLDLWEARSPFGTYHVANPGSVRAADLAIRLFNAGIAKGMARVIPGGGGDAKLSVKKLLATGVKIRSVEEAINDSIKNWKPCIST